MRKTEEIQKIIKTGIRKAGIEKQGACHTLRHLFATHLSEHGYGTIQEFMRQDNEDQDRGAAGSRKPWDINSDRIPANTRTHEVTYGRSAQNRVVTPSRHSAGQHTEPPVPSRAEVPHV